MILPAAECEIIDTWTVGGLRGTGSHDVAVHDCFVPTEFGSSFTDPHVLPEPRYRIPPFSRVIPGLGAMALGIARSAIETLTEIAARKPRSARRRPCEKTMARRSACRRRSRSSARRGCFCTTAWSSCGRC